MYFLDKDEFVPFAPKNTGEQINVHHCKQGKGNDRLYITKKEDGTILAYCHHCGKRGVHTPSGTRHISTFRKRKVSKPTKEGTINLPSDFKLDWSKWPAKALAWPTKYGITTRELTDNFMGYSDYLGGVVLPSIGPKGAITGFQVRNINRPRGKVAGKRQAKYITYTAKNTTKISRIFKPDGTWQHIFSDNERKDVLCIVEDALSAIKCSRIVDAVALNGTSLDKHSCSLLAKKYTNFLIFLDNDNPQVKRSQTKLKRTLELIAKGTIKIIYGDKDPKEYSEKELTELLKI